MNLKVFKKTLKRVSIGGVVLIGGTYMLSSYAYGFSSINNTIERDYYEIKYHTDELFDAVANEDLERINYDALGKVRSIRIDMVNANYFGNLKYFTNLEKIEICNSQLLTDENIEELNYLPLKEISLYFDRNYILKNMDKKFDLNRFINKKNIKNITFNNSTNSDEIEGIIFYEYLENYDNLAVDFIKYEPLNDALNKVIDDLNLEECETESEVVFRITEYITNHLHYDKEIYDYTRRHNSVSIFTPRLYNKLKKYNEKTISRVVSNREDSDKECVCTNYSDLGLALLIKAGIKSNTVDGTFDGTSHAWNYANVGGNDCYIDFTRVDASENIKHVIKRYNDVKIKADYDYLKEKITIDLRSESSLDYKSDKDFFNFRNYDKTCKSDINNIYGTRDNQVKVFAFNALWSLLMYEGGLSLLLVRKLIMEKIRNKRNKTVRRRKVMTNPDIRERNYNRRVKSKIR